MSINKLFYKDGTPKDLTFVLSNKGLNKLTLLNTVSDIIIHPNFNSANEASVTIKKTIDDKKANGWDELIDLKIIYVPEINEYFEAYISIADSAETTKTATLTSLCEAELSQINLYDIEINTESDILRDDYTVPTVFYKPNDPTNSLLNRILEKAPHYSIGHVDGSLMNIQRSFSVDGTSIYDFLTGTLADEIKCIFLFNTATRAINVYDMLSYCHICNNRDEFTTGCTKCGSTDFSLPYGEDTGIIISKENLAQEISVETNADQLKNCFKLRGGDELMTATIRNINPNGSDYIYDFSEETKNDMPSELVSRLDTYDEKYNEIINDYRPDFENTTLITKYNALVDKYNDKQYAQYKYDYNDEKVLTNNSYRKIDASVIGYLNLINIYYDLVDFNLYLESSLLPLVEAFDNTAVSEIDKLTSNAFDGLGLQTCTSSTSAQTVESAIKTFTKVLVIGNYKITVNTMSWDYYGTDDEGYNYGIWSGTVTLQSYKDSEDIATTEVMRFKIWDNYQYYIEQKIEKALKDYDEEYGSIYDIYKIEYSDQDLEFKSKLKYYSVARLNSFNDAYQSALDILIEVDQASEEADLYSVFYLPYYNRQRSINAELELRTSEIETIDSTIEEIEKVKLKIQEQLDLKNYLGIELWKTFNSYRREDVYENANYISDGLDNAKLIERANEFITVAKKELYKASRTQYTLTSTISNFLMMSEFLSIRDSFELGNWIRLIADEKVYKLRLISFELNYENLANIPLTFSTLSRVPGDMAEIQDIINSAKDMSTKFSYIEQQAEQSKNTNTVVESWLEKGFDATNKIVNDADKQTVVYDRNGLLVRRYNDIENKYESEQLKLVNSTLAITKDSWLTTSAAIGRIKYLDPISNEMKTAYGVNAGVLVGKLLLGESLGIYNQDNTLTFDNNGLIINTIADGTVNKNVFKIMKNNVDMISVDSNGNLILSPDVKLQWRSSSGEVGEVDSTLNQIILDANEFKIEVSKNYATQDQLTSIDGKFSSYYTRVETDAQIKVSAESITSTVEGTYTKKEEFEEAFNSTTDRVYPQYYLSTSETMPTGGDWQDNAPTRTDDKYIWYRIKTVYRNGTSVYSNESCISGSKGQTGVGIKKITDYFLISNKDDGITHSTSGWTTDNILMTPTKRFLWNYRLTEYDNNATDKSVPVVIGIYGDKGEQGVSVSNFIEHFLVTSKASGVTVNDSGWTTGIQNVTASKRYLWTYTTTVFSDSSTHDTAPKISGVWGNDGVGVSNHKVEYQVSNQAATPPAGTWSSTIPDVPSGQYLWTRVILTFSDNSTSTSYSISRFAVDGNGIESSSVSYKASTDGVNPPTGTWSASMPNVNPNEYLWTRTTLNLGDGTQVISYSVGKIGQDGNDGVGIDNIIRYYLASSLSSGVTTTTSGWTTDIQKTTSSKKYLWYYDITIFSNSNRLTSTPVIIGTYGDKGDKGDKGISINDVETYYLVSSKSSGITTGTSGWVKDKAPDMNAVNKYLWNYEIVKLDDGSNIVHTPKIIGVFGADGKGIKSYSTTYQLSDNDITPPTGTWLTTQPSIPQGKYLWTRFELIYTDDDNSIQYTVSRNPVDGADGSDGKGVDYTTTTYQKSSSGTAIPVGAWLKDIPTVNPTEYLWTRIVMTYTDKTTSTSYSVGMMGKNGEDGVSVEDIKNYFLATSAQSGVTVNTSGWTTTVQTVTSSKKYLWNYEVVELSNGNKITSPPCIIGSYGDKGDPGESALNFSIQNEAMTFTASSSGVANAATRSNMVTAYKGTTKIATTVGTISGLPTGMTITVNNNGTANTVLTIKVTTALVSESGTVNIPITADGVTQIKSFSYSLSKAGANGESAKVADISASTQVFKRLAGNTSYTPSTIVLTPHLQNCTFLKWQYSVNGGVSWSDVVSGSNGLTVGTVNNITNCLTITNTSALFTTSITSLVFRLIANASDVLDVMTISRLADGIDGNDGKDGADGVGISNVVMYYYLSTSNANQTGGSWSTTEPKWESGKYIWTKQRTNLTNNTYTETNPVCISGADGLGIKSVTPEYYLSTSSTAQAGGSWSANTVAWQKDRYIWTRFKVVHTDSSVTYTTPVRDISLDSMNTTIETISEKQSDLITDLDGITGRVSETEKQITTVNGSITSVSERVTKAEEKLTAKQWALWFTETVNNGVATSTRFTMDKDGLHILNGGIDIKNKAGEKVLYADSNGNLTLKNIDAVSGKIAGMTISTDSLSYVRTGDIGGVKGCTLNVVFPTVASSFGNILEWSINTADQADESNGYITPWEVFSKKMNCFELTASDLIAEHCNISNDLQVPFAEITSVLVDDISASSSTSTGLLYVNDAAYFYKSSTFANQNCGFFFANGSYIWDSPTPYYTLHGANDIYFASNNNTTADIIIHQSFTDLWGGLKINGYLDVTGGKHRVVETKNYGSVSMNAVESTNCLFEDNGSGIINDNGICTVFFDDIFSETVNLNCEYYVQLTKCGLGDIYVFEKRYNYFIIKGTPNLAFDWNVKAKQLGYENDRMNRSDGYASPEGGASEINNEDLATLRSNEASQLEENNNFYDSYINNLLNERE